MKNRDTIDVKHFYIDEPEGVFYHKIILILNGQDVPGVFDAVALASSGGLKKVTFEVLTCSCGIGGCAGIFEGTTIKRRRFTTEWRDIDSGLPKSFYSFNNEDYDNAIAKSIEIMRLIAKKRGDTTIDEELKYDGLFNFWTVEEFNNYFPLQIMHMKKYCQQ